MKAYASLLIAGALLLSPLAAERGSCQSSLLASTPPRSDYSSQTGRTELVGQEAPHWLEFHEMQERFNDLVLKRSLERLRKYRRFCRTPQEAKPWEDRIAKIDRYDLAWLESAKRDALVKLKDAGADPLESQYFVYVDRNPRRQLVMIGFYDAAGCRILPVGLDLTSTGNIAKGGDYYVTPTGVFENLVENFGYRALGTPNKDGWLGLGAKGSRVWDFGYTKSLRMYQGAPTTSEMRLLIHSTDPSNGEKRLGRMDSKGCIRISAGLNNYLDVHSILDRNYEEWIKSRGASWLLLKDRAPVSFPGRYLIIGDTSAEAATASR